MKNFLKALKCFFLGHEHTRPGPGGPWRPIELDVCGRCGRELYRRGRHPENVV